MRKTRATDDAGNVVIEMVLAVSLFGSILMPAVETISTVAAAYRIGENAAAIVARTWTVTESAQRAEVVTNLRARLVNTSALPLRLSVTCLPSCTAVPATVVVSAWVDSGLLGEVKSQYRLERDLYGQ